MHYNNHITLLLLRITNQCYLSWKLAVSIDMIIIKLSFIANVTHSKESKIEKATSYNKTKRINTQCLKTHINKKIQKQ